MGTIAGIFSSTEEAERAFSELQTEAGFGAEDLVLLAPGSSSKELDAVPTDEGEQPGMGRAIGGVVGGAVGLAAGNLPRLPSHIALTRQEASRVAKLPRRLGIANLARRRRPFPLRAP